GDGFFKCGPDFPAIEAPALEFDSVRGDEWWNGDFLGFAGDDLEDAAATGFGDAEESLEQCAVIGGAGGESQSPQAGSANGFEDLLGLGAGERIGGIRVFFFLRGGFGENVEESFNIDPAIHG